MPTLDRLNAPLTTPTIDMSPGPPTLLSLPRITCDNRGVKVAVPAVKVGREVYPLPGLVMVRFTTRKLVPLVVIVGAVPAARTVPAEMLVMVGAAVYPLPIVGTVTPLGTPLTSSVNVIAPLPEMATV